MAPIPKRWQITPRISPEIDQELREYPPILRQILYNRGYPTSQKANQYLAALPPKGTDPFDLLGVPKAVARINNAIHYGEPIAIYGDYDVDGVTATAMLVQFLRRLGAKVTEYIPNRFDEGYGLNMEAVDWLHDQGIKLVITVDCGIRSLAEVEHTNDLGMDIILTDHHHPRTELPAALAIINPKQPNDNYPEKDLAGVGLAYKLATAINPKNEIGKPNAEEYLDLVALGTVADLAPLTGENRSLVRQGLHQLRYPQRQGVLSLMGVAGIKPQNISASDIGFVLGPRLNAAGRLDTAMASYELLTTRDISKAGTIAQFLEMQNRKRQKITREIYQKAEEIAFADNLDPPILFAVHEDFNLGVVGLAASRLTEAHYRPSIVAHRGEEYTRGSCRSISEFHITDALDQCADLLVHHGGHAAAAGFTVRNSDLPKLEDRLHKIAHNKLSGLDLKPTLVVDAEVPLSNLDHKLLHYLDLLQPTGYANPHALFVSRDLKVAYKRAVGKEGAHLKFKVTDGWITYDAIAFRQGYWDKKMPKRVDLVYSFELNEYRDRQTLQLNVQDIKPTNTPAV